MTTYSYELLDTSSEMPLPGTSLLTWSNPLDKTADKSSNFLQGLSSARWKVSLAAVAKIFDAEGVK